MASGYFFSQAEYHQYSVYQQNFGDQLKAKDEELGKEFVQKASSVGLSTAQQLPATIKQVPRFVCEYISC